MLLQEERLQVGLEALAEVVLVAPAEVLRPQLAVAGAEAALI